MKSLIVNYFDYNHRGPCRVYNVTTIADVWRVIGGTPEEWHDKDIIATVNGDVVDLSRTLENDDYVCFYAKGKYG
jgi:hypothetical protein